MLFMNVNYKMHINFDGYMISSGLCPSCMIFPHTIIFSLFDNVL